MDSWPHTARPRGVAGSNPAAAAGGPFALDQKESPRFPAFPCVSSAISVPLLPDGSAETFEAPALPGDRRSLPPGRRNATRDSRIPSRSWRSGIGNDWRTPSAPFPWSIGYGLRTTLRPGRSPSAGSRSTWGRSLGEMITDPSKDLPPGAWAPRVRYGSFGRGHARRASCLGSFLAEDSAHPRSPLGSLPLCA